MQLTSKQKLIFETTIRLKNKHKVIEWEIVSNLQDVAAANMYAQTDCTDLFTYAVKHYEFTRDVAYAFMSVAKKAKVIPRLQCAIKNSEINVASAKRLAPHIKEENADELIVFSKTHSHRETERKLAELGGPVKSVDRVKRIAGGKVRITIEMTEEDFEFLERTKAIEAQKGRILSNGEAIATSVRHFVERKDPVKKAERAQARREKNKKVGAPLLSQSDGFSGKDDFDGIKTTYGRENMTAAQINAVNNRDKGRCTHIGSDGMRCGQDRWTDIHHIRTLAEGGSNHPTNLTTLCGIHHDILHQLPLHIDVPFDLLRSPQRPYGTKGAEDWESAQLQKLNQLAPTQGVKFCGYRH